MPTRETSVPLEAGGSAATSPRGTVARTRPPALRPALLAEAASARGGEGRGTECPTWHSPPEPLGCRGKASPAAKRRRRKPAIYSIAAAWFKIVSRLTLRPDAGSFPGADSKSGKQLRSPFLLRARPSTLTTSLTFQSARRRTAVSHRREAFLPISGRTKARRRGLRSDWLIIFTVILGARER